MSKNQFHLHHKHVLHRMEEKIVINLVESLDVDAPYSLFMSFSSCVKVFSQCFLAQYNAPH